MTIKSNINFLKKIPIPSKNLPLTLMLLEEWTLIKLQGKNLTQYLQNQLTCDFKNLKNNQYSFSAYCYPTGKTISNMYVFHLDHQQAALIIRTNMCDQQISEMKKYSIFSKITIFRDNDTTLLGISGKNSKKYLSMFFRNLPDKTCTKIYEKNTVILYINQPIIRFLLIITDQSILYNLLNQSKFEIQTNNSCQWATLDIEAGYPLIEPETSGIFLPQAMNLDILHGISFNKGCYIGQESIARIQYRKCNKKKLYKLSGSLNKIHKNPLPKPGTHLEYKINDQNWKYIGTILKSYQIKENKIWIQAILNMPINSNTLLRPESKDNKNYFNLYYK